MRGEDNGESQSDTFQETFERFELVFIWELSELCVES